MSYPYDLPVHVSLNNQVSGRFYRKTDNCRFRCYRCPLPQWSYCVPYDDENDGDVDGDGGYVPVVHYLFLV